MFSLKELIEETKQKLQQQEAKTDEVLLNQAEIIVSQEYANCLLELQSL